MSCRTILSTASALGLAALLAACGGERAREGEPVRTDPSLIAAIFDPIMIDSTLSGQDRNTSVVSADDAARVAIPVVENGPEAANAARLEALRLVGGKITPAPVAVASGANGLGSSPETAAQIAAASGPGGAACASGLEYSARWAAVMPDALPIYPRAAVQEGAGTDAGSCHVRVVNFLTAVEPGDVIDFYYTRVRKAGYDAGHRLDGETHVLSGRKGAVTYMVHARAHGDGMTEVDLVTSGL